MKSTKEILTGNFCKDDEGYKRVQGKVSQYVNSEDEAATKLIGDCDSSSGSGKKSRGSGSGSGGGSGSASESSEGAPMKKAEKISAKANGVEDTLLVEGRDEHRRRRRRRHRGAEKSKEKVADIGAQGFMQIEKKGGKHELFGGHKAQPFTKKAREKFVEFVCTASLNELQSGAKQARLVPGNDKLVEHLGGEDLPITSMEVVKFKNPAPVSIGLIGEHYKGNEHNFISAAGTFLTICDALETTKDAPQLPVTVHQAKPSAFQMKMAKHYPNQTPASMIAAIAPGFEEGKKVLLAGSALMIPIRDQIESDEATCAKKKMDYTGATLESLAVRHNNQITGYQVPNEMAEFAANWITTSFDRTKDTLNVNTDFYIPFARAGLPCESLSAAGEHWTHRAEIEQNPKVASVDKALAQTYTWTALVKVRFGNQ